MEFQNGSFISICSAVVGSGKESNYLWEISVLPNVGFEALVLSLMCSYEGDKIVFLQEIVYGNEAKVIRTASGRIRFPNRILES